MKEFEKKYIDDYDKFPVIMKYKLIGNNSTYILDKIILEDPIYVICDIRLYDFLKQCKDVRLPIKEVIDSLGYELIYKNIKFFFCKTLLQRNLTKVLCYKRDTSSCVSMLVHLP